MDQTNKCLRRSTSTLPSDVVGKPNDIPVVGKQHQEHSDSHPSSGSNSSSPLLQSYYLACSSKKNLGARTSASHLPSQRITTSPDLSFPGRLFIMLSDSDKESFEDVVCWILEGAAFKVHKQDEFVETILPRYFKMTKYNSFTRQLHAYEFTWIKKGQQRGGCEQALRSAMRSNRG
jgi:hypothetical protein